MNHEDRRRETGPATEISEDERGVDAVLTLAGQQWRDRIPSVTFEGPSSRGVVLGRAPRTTLAIGIAAAVVAIVLAGSAVIGRSGTVVPQAPASTSIQSPSSAGSEGLLVARNVDVASALVDPANHFPPTDAPIWAGWDVASGQLVVAVRGTSCSGEPVAMTLTRDQQVEVSTGVNGPCDDSRWRVSSFRVPTDLDPWSPVTVVMPQGTVQVAGIAGIVTFSVGAPSAAAVEIPRRQGGTEAVRLSWDAAERSLFLTGPAATTCLASVVAATSRNGGSTVDLGTAEVVHGRAVPTTGSFCSVGQPDITTEIRLPPQIGAGFFVVNLLEQTWTVPTSSSTG